MKPSSPPRPLTPEHYSSEEVVKMFGLVPLESEGGWFRRTAVSDLVLSTEALPPVYAGTRRGFSVILCLLTSEGYSALHKLVSEEVWCFHAGDPLESLRLHPDGTVQWVHLGLNLHAGQRLQDVVPAQVWQGTRLCPGGRWALVSCMVAPEFTWNDFELGDRDGLTGRYPAHAADIRSLTREVPSG